MNVPWFRFLPSSPERTRLRVSQMARPESARRTRIFSKGELLWISELGTFYWFSSWQVPVTQGMAEILSTLADRDRGATSSPVHYRESELVFVDLDVFRVFLC